MVTNDIFSSSDIGARPLIAMAIVTNTLNNDHANYVFHLESPFKMCKNGFSLKCL
jgi:hypothetical protein